MNTFIKQNWLKIIILVVVLIVILFVVWFFIKGSDSITIYSRSCNQINVSAKDCKSWNLGKEIYYVNKNTQEVMFDGSYGPVPYKDCHVVDANNWYCDLGTGISGLTDIISYRNGVFTEDTPSSRMSAIEHFGLFKYWLYKIFGSNAF